MTVRNPSYLAVKNFADFQHYKDRNPLWIKLYNAVMDDEAFIALSDAARGHLMLIWLLASRRENRIPNDPKAVRRAIQSKGPVDLDALIAAGFLISHPSASELIAESAQPASKPLAASGSLASNSLASRAPARSRREEERREETETEQTTASSSAREASNVGDVDRLLAALPDDTMRMSWKAEIAAARVGLHGQPRTDEQIARACRDYVGNGNLQPGKAPSLRHFRAFLRNAGKPEGNGSGQSSRLGKTERGRQNLAASLARLEAEGNG